MEACSRLLFAPVRFYGASTHAAEEVVLQVESDITVLLDGAEDLKAMGVRIDMLQTDSFVPMAHLDSLGSNLLFREVLVTSNCRVQTRGPWRGVLEEHIPRDHSGHHRRQRH